MLQERPQELWRLCNSRGHLATCCVSGTPEGLLLVVRRNDEIILTERHELVTVALARCEELRTQYVSEGWTGEFPRR